MKLAEDEEPISTYYFKGATDSRNTSVLTNRRLVVIYKSVEESYPLSKITAVKVSFQRSILSIFLGIGALCLTFWLANVISDTANKMDSMVAEMQEQPQRYAQIQQEGQQLQTLVNIGKLAGIPFMFMASLYLIYFGWRGYTAMVITYFAGEKTYAKHGRDQRLLEFAELISHQMK